MVRGLPWWRKLGAVFAALVLSVLTFGPSLDGILCHDEGGLSAAAAELPSLKASPDADLTGHKADGLAPCIHGHCHHGAAYVPVLPIASETPHELRIHAQRLPRQRVATSDPKFGLMRPPRA